MEYPSPSTPDFASLIIGSGVLGLVIFLVSTILAFIISAFIVSLWIRLILVFMRTTLDREYDRVRVSGLEFAQTLSRSRPSQPATLPNDQGPNEWRS